MAEYCSACNKIKDQNPEFVVQGITLPMYNSLKNNTGLKPSLKHNNCEDLNDLNDCLLGSLYDKIDAYTVCDWQEFMKEYLTNQQNINTALIASDCGQWEQIAKIWNKIIELENILIDREGYVTVTKIYTHTVSKDKFIRGVSTVNSSWWSGSVGKGESFISIPVSDMDIVDSVTAQPQVVGDHSHAVTVAIQENYRSGDNFIVNFDTYEIENDSPGTLPFAVPVIFIVVGRKKVK